MRIVFVTHQYPPNYTTGTELYAKRLALKLRGTAGHDVRVFTFEPSYRADAPLVRREETVDDGVPVTRVYMWRGLLPNFVLGDSYNVFLGKIFGTYLSQVQPDAVHVFHAAFLGASILEESTLRSIPTVVNLMDFWFICPTAQLLKTRTQERCAGPDAFQCLECLSHGDLDYDRLLSFTRGDRFVPITEETAPPGDGLRWNNATPHAQLSALGARRELLRRLLLRADRIIAPSMALKRTFERFDYPADRIQVSRYGVDPMPPYTFDKSSEPSLRVGFIGSINRPKGLHVLVDAVLNSPGPLTLDVYGNPGLFPDYAESCFARARKDARIRLRGPTKPEHVPTALRDLDVLVVPSLWQENTPFVVLEACAAGVPVIASNVDGIAEIVRDGDNGRLFEPGDAAALGAILLELANDRAALRRMSGKFADVRTLLANAREFAAMYEDLVRHKRAPRPAGEPDV